MIDTCHCLDNSTAPAEVDPHRELAISIAQFKELEVFQMYALVTLMPIVQRAGDSSSNQMRLV